LRLKSSTLNFSGCETYGILMRRLPIFWAVAATAVSGAMLAALWPHAQDAGRLLAAQDDPVALSDIQVNSALRNNQSIIGDETEAALKDNDSDLAGSFLDLAREKNVSLPNELTQKVSDALAQENSSSHLARRFASGLVTGDVSDAASLSGTVVGDLFVFGDIRDVVREDTDRLVLGLAAAGLAVTAATYVSIGGIGPVRAGLTLFKDARKVGRLGEGLTEWAGRSAREIVDTPMLQNAVASGSALRPVQTAGAIRAAFNAEKAGALVRLAKDVGRVGEKAGARGALDTLRIAEGPEDVARAARLAEARGSKTRAILKLLGRSSLLLAGAAFDLSLWVLGAIFALFGFLSSIKATTERLTQSWLDRKKARALRIKLAAVQPGLANAGSNG
jgi:hypothetical protein